MCSEEKRSRGIECKSRRVRDGEIETAVSGGRGKNPNVPEMQRVASPTSLSWAMQGPCVGAWRHLCSFSQAWPLHILCIEHSYLSRTANTL